jgi:hypothetical protein
MCREAVVAEFQAGLAYCTVICVGAMRKPRQSGEQPVPQARYEPAPPEYESETWSLEDTSSLAPFYTTVPIIRPLKVHDRLSLDGRSVRCQAVSTCHRFSCSNLHLLIPIRHVAYLQGFSPHKHGLRQPHALHYSSETSSELYLQIQSVPHSKHLPPRL